MAILPQPGSRCFDHVNLEPNVASNAVHWTVRVVEKDVINPKILFNWKKKEIP
jgi:hypothetical protein